jgi:hypothetical protein
MTTTTSTIGLKVAMLLLPMFLAGCAANRPMTPPLDCPSSCEVNIGFPGSPGGKPTVPHDQQTVRARVGAEINFRVPGGGNHKRMLLVFSEPALADARNDALWTVPLKPGRNRFKVLDTEKCGTPGCKYVVIDLDNPRSEPLDPWIIIDR